MIESATVTHDLTVMVRDLRMPFVNTHDTRPPARAPRPRRTGTFIFAVALAAAILTAGFAAGIGLMAALGNLRDTSLNAVTNWETSSNELLIIGGIGVFGWLTIGSLYILILRRREVSIAVGPAFFGLLGMAAGLFVQGQRLHEPVRVGKKVDPIFNTSLPWQTDSWVWYYLPLWFPALIAIVALIVLASTVRRHRREQTEARRRVRRTPRRSNSPARQRRTLPPVPEVTETIPVPEEIPEPAARPARTPRFQDAPRRADARAPRPSSFTAHANATGRRHWPADAKVMTVRREATDSSGASPFLLGVVVTPHDGSTPFYSSVTLTLPPNSPLTELATVGARFAVLYDPLHMVEVAVDMTSLRR